MKQHEELRQIPIVVFTSSDAEYDLFRSYELGAHGHVTKPVDLQAFQRSVQAIGDFWLATAKLP